MAETEPLHRALDPFSLEALEFPVVMAILSGRGDCQIRGSQGHQGPNLPQHAGHGKVRSMSVTQVLKQVKALPPRDRRRFFAGVRALEEALQREHPARRTRPIRWPDAVARRRRIFGDRVLPNLVLLARDEERY